jgi:hypothetical protein
MAEFPYCPEMSEADVNKRGRTETGTEQAHLIHCGGVGASVKQNGQHFQRTKVASAV